MNDLHNPSFRGFQSEFVGELRTQKSTITSIVNTYPCPSDKKCQFLTFQTRQQVWDHFRTNHINWFKRLLGTGMTPLEIENKICGMSEKKSRDTYQSTLSRKATAGGGFTPDITNLTLEPEDESRQSSPNSGKKRPVESEGHRRREDPTHVEMVDADYKRNIPHSVVSERAGRLDATRLFGPDQASTNASSLQRSATEAPSIWSRDATKNSSQAKPSRPQSTSRPLPHRSAPKARYPHRRPGFIELQRYDPRYAGLLLQPDSRPISQKQLVSEVNSIYAGLKMAETKCIHVDRAQAAVAQDSSDPNHKLASDHWQALIALHRTLLHEHHDFFLASQHPSAQPALRRLAAEYSMPARMWKHGIHSFLELLRRRLPDSIDYTLAFIYLAYQMMALLYETVPAFEDTWIECLGDLGRYRMAIEDEDICDRETWAGVARSWYTKASDKNPTVGRLYHRLAILPRPNALQQLYYYSRFLTCVKSFRGARQSILALLDPILGRAAATYSHALPIDTNYIKAHALLFEKLSLDDFKQARTEFLDNLDNHIGRATAKWKEQGVCIAVTNVAGWFNYGFDDNSFRQVFLTELVLKAKNSPAAPEEQPRTVSPADQQEPATPSVPENELQSTVDALCSQPHFEHAKKLTMLVTYPQDEHKPLVRS
ncbi:hypothetical protein HBH98_255250 [Parastagonospora nodorum]|nr:hypothetical protein HBH98_255250 [Parastagonospora nodorum]